MRVSGVEIDGTDPGEIVAVLLALERLDAFERFRLWRNRAGHGKRASWDEACAESFGHAEAGREAGRRGQRRSDHVVLLLLAKTGEHVAQRRVLGFLVRMRCTWRGHSLPSSLGSIHRQEGAGPHYQTPVGG